MKLKDLPPNASIIFSTALLKYAGFWAPNGYNRVQLMAYRIYGFISFTFLLGTYLFIQIVDMYMIWGNLPAMTGNAFLLFTNLSQTAKLVNIMMRKKNILRVIEEGHDFMAAENNPETVYIVESYKRECLKWQIVYFSLTTITISGWAAMPYLDGGSERALPLRAWYPYDTTISPWYEMTYAHQMVAIFIAAYLNVSKDILVVSMFSQATCRLRIIENNLRMITKEYENEGPEIETESPEKLPNTKDGSISDDIVCPRLIDCVKRHQAVLEMASDLEEYFNIPILFQLSVSLVIICFTTFQLGMESGASNAIRLMSTITYLMNMTYQVFLYCWHGNELREESQVVIRSAYQCCWYRCSNKFRRILIILTERCFKSVNLTAGSFVGLSIDTFMALIKASYSFFTVLKQVSE